MKISFEPKAGKADAYVFFISSGGHVPATLKKAALAEGFDGKKGKTLVIAAPEGIPAKHAVLLGVGKDSSLDAMDFERFGSQLLPILNQKKAVNAAIVGADDLDLEKTGHADAFARMAQGMVLNAYRFDKYMTREPKEKKPTLKSAVFVTGKAASARKEFAPLQKMADAVYLTRDLVSEAPNVLYPESFASIIRKELSPLRIKVSILNDKDIKRLGMGALTAVGQGSSRLPRLVTMQYNGGRKNDPYVAFVGKGVTFDTGGISLKPGPGMEEMKWDMAGAGAVVGAMKALAARQAKVNVVGVVALAENMPSGNACRPGDIVKSMSGQTIQIDNTDAEGRLILCDALWYCQEKFKPTHIVDLATLTGAMIIALGHEYAGVFSNDDKFANDLVAVSKEVGEPLWHMPLHDAWDKAIDCMAADMKNISGGRDAGSAIGAHFLKRFIKDGVKWAHLDIAGVAWTNKDRTSAPKGATAFGVRLLDAYVRKYCE